MAEPIPIACSLDRDERVDRGREFRDLAARALVDRERRDNWLRLRFRIEAEDAVRELVRQEKQCCPFFEFDVSTREDVVQVDVSAPPDGAPFLDALYEAVHAP